MRNIEIVFATRNKHKVKEIEYLLNCEEDHGPNQFAVKLLSLDDVGYEYEIEETGKDFFSNAKIKALTLRDHTNMICLSDDSGLCVKYLDDAPGVYSKTYAGPDASDDENIDKLLAELEGVPRAERAAKFVCVLCMALPGDNHFYTMGECDGFILEARRGTNGFGYDPVFLFASMFKSFGELSAEAKNKYSHRAVAVQKLKKKLGYYIK